VPRFLLKNFADNDGCIYRLDIQSDKITKPSPRMTASKPGFNEFSIDGQIISFEERLEKIETKAAPSIQQIIAARSLSGLAPNKRKYIADFIAAQSFRTEACYKGLRGNPSRDDFASLLSRLWDSLPILSTLVADRHWALMAIESDEFFYLGDNPVVLQRTADAKDGSNLGFDVAGVEAFMPLSPRVALYMPCRTTSEHIIAYFETIGLELDSQKYPLNKIAISDGRANKPDPGVMARQRLVEAFVNGRPIPAVTENIENLNYLQCSWAHEGIFSNKKDFSFARYVFERSPQYKSTPQVKIVNGNVLVPTSNR
jgi:hypothetical protein